MLETEIIDYKNQWPTVLNAARTTIGKDEIEKEPSSKWKKQILLAEHSPIRKVRFNFKWRNLLSWVSVHFVRHKIGIEHFVRSQRTDRTGIDRNELKQSELIEHEIDVNAQALINISRKRLCHKASKETREAWRAILENIKYKEPELYNVCVPECIYRGFCPEFNGCGYDQSCDFLIMLNEYRSK
jgi:hypothetical protein